ncbi:hypothetical protein SODG_004160 [Sodalis praecaptivus]
MNRDIATVDSAENVYAHLKSALLNQGIAALLPAHVTPEQFTRTAATALVKDSDLQFADRQSLVLALTKCAGEGLLPDGREAALVVRQTKNSSTGQYEDRVVYMPMVDGVLKRARQSGQVANIVSKAVYTADQFDYWVDERGEHLKHRPAFEDWGELRLVYAFAKLTSGELVVEVMGRAEVDKVRATVSSSGKGYSPWAKWYDRMAFKTVLHRLARRLPCASEMYSLFDAEQAPAEGRTEAGAAHRPTVNARPRLRDVLNNHRFTPAPQATASETAPVPAENPAPEPEAMPPALEAALIAFDDATDEESYQSVVEHCKTLAQTLSDAHRGVLRAKMNQTKARIRKPHAEAYTHAEIKAPVAMAEGHPDPARPPLNIIPLANSSGTGWRFPDNSIETGYVQAQQRASAMGCQLQAR